MLHKSPQLCSMVHVLSVFYQRSWQHQQCRLQCRHLEVVGCGTASPIASGISALQNLEHLDIWVGDSVGTIGKLRALTWLHVGSHGLGPLYELHLEIPKLQCLSLEPNGDNNCLVREHRFTVHLFRQPSLWIPASSCDGRLLLAGRAHVAVLLQPDNA